MLIQHLPYNVNKVAQSSVEKLKRYDINMAYPEARQAICNGGFLGS